MGPDAFLRRVAETIRRHGMAAPGDSVLAAVSGGPDSLALLVALVELAPMLGLRVGAAHFQHGLRGEESEEDERFVRSVAERLGVPFRAGRWRERREGSRANLEEEARKARYSFLLETARSDGWTRVATGHTLDDQAETVLLRILRGTGIRGLAGIQPVRPDGVVRPLLEVRRQEVDDFLRKRGLVPRSDSSNRDPSRPRNRLRHELLPFLATFQPRVAERLALLAEAARGEAELEDWALGELRKTGLAEDERLPRKVLASLPGSVRLVLLRAWLLERRGHLRGLSARHWRALAALADRAGEIHLPGGGRVVREQEGLRYVTARVGGEAEDGGVPKVLSPGSVVEWVDGWVLEASEVSPYGSGRGRDLPRDLWEAVLDADGVGFPLEIRSFARGERVRPLNLGGSRKVSDVFVDRKVSRFLRSAWPVVAAAEGIVWIPGVVRSEVAKVTARTRRVVRIRAIGPG
ncbi:MAG: tRNA(Ile)-lysidine synthase [Candidatus Binatia bacterium]|nr:MAG: tRNA(Ile)-lysidine synthase [Candidatus Binatia bacterium]